MTSRACVYAYAAVLLIVLGLPAAAPAATATVVHEGGAADSYGMQLTSQPRAPVTVEVIADGQVVASPAVLRFDADTWATPQQVTVRAVDDGVDEGTHEGEIAHRARSRDAHYNDLLVSNLVVVIHDNDLGTGAALVRPEPGAAIGPARPGLELQLAHPGGVHGVAVAIDGELWEVRDIPEAPRVTSVTLDWQAGPAASVDGIHDVDVLVRGPGASRERARWQVLVDGTAPHAPKLAHGEEVRVGAEGHLRIDASASDTVALESMTLLIDGEPAALQSAHGAASLDAMFFLEPGSVPPGEHEFSVVAVDTAGNQSQTTRTIAVLAADTPAPAAPGSEPATGDPSGELPEPLEDPDRDDPGDSGASIVISPAPSGPGAPVGSDGPPDQELGAAAPDEAAAPAPPAVPAGSAGSRGPP